MNSLDYIFYPKSIAVIGASRDESSVGNNIVRNLVVQGYSGKIYPINPKANNLYGLEVFSDIDNVNSVDLTIIAIPALLVQEAVEKAVNKSKAIIVISSGFKESGENLLEEKIKRICQSKGIPLIGPNCLGVINPEIKMNASFANIMPKDGNIAFISQSGALCTTIIDYAQDLGLGFSKFVSIGNKAGINELDLIKYLGKDKKTKLIAIYSEELTHGPEIIEAAKLITQGHDPKPIIILKSGKTELGARAVVSHTGSMAGSDEIYNALFKQSGIIRASSIQEFLNFVQIFSKNDLAKAQNVAVITNAGGPAVIATDEIASSGLSLAKFSKATEDKLKEILPPASHLENPIDILGDAKADRYEQTLEVVVKDDNVDSVLILLTPQSMTEIDQTAEAIIRIKNKTSKPLLACFMGKSTVESGIKLIKSSEVISMNFPETSIKNLASFDKFYNWSKTAKDEFFRFEDVDENKVAEIIRRKRKAGETIFPEAEALEILRVYNFPLLKYGRALTPEEAEKIAKNIGNKVAMKIISRDILHKTEAGGVKLEIDINNAADEFRKMIKAVSQKIPQAKIEGILLEEMAPKDGIETILGANKSSLGTAMMFGLGGVYVEVLKDVSFGIVPITQKDAKRMIEELKSGKILAGFRGTSYDIEAILDCLGRLSQLLSDFPEIKELDINPLLVLPEGEGVKVLDARIVI